MTEFGSIGSMDAVTRLEEQVQRLRRESVQYVGGPPAPDLLQIGMVLRALADHTSLSQAVRYAPDPEFDPAATSVGRWLHAYADACQARWTSRSLRALEDQS